VTLPLRTKLLYAASNVGRETLARSRSLWLVDYYPSVGLLMFRTHEFPDHVDDRLEPEAPLPAPAVEKPLLPAVS
jgi:hypothetical protein